MHWNPSEVVRKTPANHVRSTRESDGQSPHTQRNEQKPMIGEHRSPSLLLDKHAMIFPGRCITHSFPPLNEDRYVPRALFLSLSTSLQNAFCTRFEITTCRAGEPVNRSVTNSLFLSLPLSLRLAVCVFVRFKTRCLTELTSLVLCI